MKVVKGKTTRLARWIGLAPVAIAIASAAPPAAAQTEARSQHSMAVRSPALHIEMQYFTLPNGLKVVMARDLSAPTVTVRTYYGIGFRLEPRDRTGFAHLFEHLMFQGSEHASKGVMMSAVTTARGVLDASTRFDYTNYFEIVPSNALEQILWFEADRMGRIAITQEGLTNQQGVISNEVKVNVLNRPYGGWPWLDVPQLANENWYNAHNFYGELATSRRLRSRMPGSSRSGTTVQTMRCWLSPGTSTTRARGKWSSAIMALYRAGSRSRFPTFPSVPRRQRSSGSSPIH